MSRRYDIKYALSGMTGDFQRIASRLDDYHKEISRIANALDASFPAMGALQKKVKESSAAFEGHAQRAGAYGATLKTVADIYLLTEKKVYSTFGGALAPEDDWLKNIFDIGADWLNHLISGIAAFGGMIGTTISDIVDDVKSGIDSFLEPDVKDKSKNKETTDNTPKPAETVEETVTKTEEPAEEPFKSELVDRLRNDTSLGLSQAKKETMIIMASTLLKEGYEPAFVAGILGNILAEGTAGAFESSAYIKNPAQEPGYLAYIDKKYNYRSEFSGKNISEVGVAKTYALLQELEKSGYEGKFGLGCVQWTGGRTMGLIDCYIEVCGENGYPTTEQCLQAESLFIARELNGNYQYVYDAWLSEYGDKDNSAYGAGSVVCLKYEVPAHRDEKAITRGNSAQAIYNVMTGSD